MMALSLCEKYCPNKIPALSLGKRIAGGADGELFEIKNDPHKVIKFCVQYQIENYLHTKNVIQHIINTKTQAYVRIYTYEHMGTYSRMIYGNQKEKFILYYYVMQRLNKLSEDEMKVFSSFVSNEEDAIKKDFSIEKIDSILKDLKNDFDFDYVKVKTFYEDIKKCIVVQEDLHIKNIMKDNENNFRLIDLDRCKLKN